MTDTVPIATGDARLKSGSLFAWRAVTVFAVGIAWVVALDLCEQNGVIDKRTEGLLRLMINTVLVSSLLVMTLRSCLSTKLRSLILLTLIASLADTTLGFTEDVTAWNQVPIIGRDSQARPTIEAVISASWMLGGFALIYGAIFAMRRSHEILNQRNQRLESALTSLKRAQRPIVQRERLTALGEMASGVAHDLNNTLSPVVAYSELLLKSSDLTHEQQRWVDCIHEGALDMASTVKGLKQFHESSNTARKPTDLQPLIQQVVQLTRPRWRDESQRDGHEISVQVELHHCPMVKVDPRELRTALTNLIFNAVDALPYGGVISIRLYEHGREVVISISDNGVGMSEEQQNRCFEPFVSWKHDGTGLGLSMCHGIITAQGGSISVESTIGEGTTFHLRFPSSFAVERNNEAIRHTSSSVRRVLLIDDDQAVRDSMVAMLEVLGVDVCAVSSGEEAVDAIQSTNEFDLVITDLGMAGMDGVEVVGSIRQINPQQPIAVVSGWSHDDVRRRLGSHQCLRLIQKPATIDDLEMLVRELPTGVQPSPS